MIKHLIALDLDGTLLTDDKKITKRTKETLQKAKEAGHEIMIATGRPFRSSHPYYIELDLTTPIVNFNGAFVHHPLDDAWGMFHTPLELSTVQQIVQACDQYEVKNIIAEVMDDVYFHYHDEKLIDIFSFGNPKVATGDLRTILEKNPTSILIHAEEAEVESIRNHLTSVHAEKIDHRRWAAPWHVIEIVRTGMNKAVGIDRVAKHLGIDQQHVIAFGDEDNDFEMIKYAGMGVAMGNAIPLLKDVANDVTATNEEDGIAVFLEKYLSL